jgi:2-methylcitrate dehydratase
VIPTALATAEAFGCSGAEALLGIVIGYEVAGTLVGATRIRERGWDQGTFIAVGAAAAAGKLMGLSKQQLGHAVAIAVTSNIATRQTRVGELSMWKGCAAAAAGRNGILAALLAREGMTGPAKPFTGKDGIIERVTGPISIELGFPKRGPYIVECSNFKLYPAEYNSLGPLDIIFSLREIVRAENVEKVDVETYWLAYSEIGMEPEKWHPHTRETADHSLPFLIATAIIDGRIGQDSFAPNRLFEPGVNELMARIAITENKEYSARFPDELKTAIRIQLKTGELIERMVTFPRGHHQNPPSDREIDAKFDSICQDRKDAASCQAAKNAVWNLDSLDRVSDLFDLLTSIEAG